LQLDKISSLGLLPTIVVVVIDSDFFVDKDDGLLDVDEDETGS
jgi:hypothetical protein